MYVLLWAKMNIVQVYAHIFAAYLMPCPGRDVGNDACRVHATLAE